MNKELILYIIIGVLAVCCLLSIFAAEQDIKEYRKAYEEAVIKFNQCNSGYVHMDTANGVWLPNYTIEDYR
jgi:hypothetical protein